MSKRRLVDTNLIVRYLVQDHEKHAKAAGKLFDACDRGDVVIVVRQNSALGRQFAELDLDQAERFRDAGDALTREILEAASLVDRGERLVDPLFSIAADFLCHRLEPGAGVQDLVRGVFGPSDDVVEPLDGLRDLQMTDRG